MQGLCFSIMIKNFSQTKKSSMDLNCIEFMKVEALPTFERQRSRPGINVMPLDIMDEPAS